MSIDISAYRDTMSEADLQEMIREAAILNGWMVYHAYDSRRTTAGFPDLVLIRDGVLIFAELKSAKGRLSEDQGIWIRALNQIHKTRAYIWRPADVDEIVEMLQSEREAG